MITPWIAALIAAGFFTGAAVGTAATHDRYDRTNDISITAQTTSHEDACAARYRTYDLDSDMYRGSDGDWHRCRL